MPQEITTMDGGEAPLSVRNKASNKGSKAAETDTMQQSGGQAPSPGYTPDAPDPSQKASAVAPQGGGDPALGGVVRAR